MYDQKSNGNNRYFATNGFRYELDEDCSVSLSHNLRRFDEDDGKTSWVNRVLLEFTYAF